MRQQALPVVFSAIGDGRVVTTLVPESLLPVGESVYNAPNTPSTPNTILHRGYAKSRPGYRNYTTTFASPAVRRINGLFTAVWDNGTTDLIAATDDDIFRDNAGTWASIEGTTPHVVTGSEFAMWTFAMMRATGSASPHNELHCCNGVGRVLVYDKAGAPSAVIALDPATVGFSGAKVLLPQRGRALAMNVLDASGSRRSQRIMYSVVGNPRDYSGVGSGFVDLDDDAFPVAAAVNMGGRVVVYKGDQFGGSIVVGTPTGVLDAPYRWDTIGGVGILAPRALRVINDAQAFIVGHDGFYLHDGARGLLQVGDEISRSLLPRFNVTRREQAVSFYVPEDRLLYVGLPLDNSITPNEWWVFDVTERKFSGPITFPLPFWCAARYGSTGSITWNTTGSTWGDLTWDTLPYTSWDGILLSSTQARIVLSSHTGQVVQMNLTDTTDNITPINAKWRSPTFTPAYQRLPRGKTQRIVDFNDMLALRTVTMRYADTGVTWTPKVYVSTDGGKAWTLFSNDTHVGGNRGTAGHLRAISYESGTGVPGDSFIIEIVGNGNMKLRDVACEFCYAGDRRNA